MRSRQIRFINIRYILSHWAIILFTKSYLIAFFFHRRHCKLWWEKNIVRRIIFFFFMKEFWDWITATQLEKPPHHLERIRSWRWADAVHWTSPPREAVAVVSTRFCWTAATRRAYQTSLYAIPFELLSSWLWAILLEYELCVDATRTAATTVSVRMRQPKQRKCVILIGAHTSEAFWMPVLTDAFSLFCYASDQF